MKGGKKCWLNYFEENGRVFRKEVRKSRLCQNGKQVYVKEGDGTVLTENTWEQCFEILFKLIEKKSVVIATSPGNKVKHFKNIKYLK